MERARQCLSLTTPSVQLKYPTDAEAHFAEIHRVMEKWLPFLPYDSGGYWGPKIEDTWVNRTRTLIAKRPKGQKLVDLFGPYIPLLRPWNDNWINGKPHWFPMGFLSSLLSVLRPEVPYITVSQNDDGLTGGHCELMMDWVPNLLVLSAGGFGHVAVPLFNQPEIVRDQKPLKNRTYHMSYVGSMIHAPYNLREAMGVVMRRKSQELNFKTFVGLHPSWRDVMADSRIQMCPRGWGRNSYHVVETLQSGLVPVHIYTDTPWVPYPDLFEKIGYTVTMKQLPSLVDRLCGPGIEEELARREALVLKYRDSHFSLPGTMKQIDDFMLHGGGDLRCRPLPATKLDKGEACPHRGRPVRLPAAASSRARSRSHASQRRRKEGDSSPLVALASLPYLE